MSTEPNRSPVTALFTEGEDTIARAPLAFDAAGVPLDLPVAARGWRVEKLTGKRHMTAELCYDECGSPLLVKLDYTAEDLVEDGMTPGRYRLVAVDSQFREVGAVAAICQITAAMVPAPVTAPKEGRDQVIDALCQAVRDLTGAQVKFIEAAAGGRISPVQPSAVAASVTVDGQATAQHALPPATSLDGIAGPLITAVAEVLKEPAAILARAGVISMATKAAEAAERKRKEAEGDGGAGQ